MKEIMCVWVFTKLTNYFQLPIKVREANVRKTLTVVNLLLFTILTNYEKSF